MTAKTPIRLQGNEVDCGATCLGIILEYYGFKNSILELRRLCAVGRDGATVVQIQRGAEALGHRCTITKKGIESLKRAKMPLVLHWELRHFVVLEGFRGDRVWINDPATGRRKMTRQEFDRCFTGVCLEIEPRSTEDLAQEETPWRVLKSLVPKGQMHFRSAFWIGLISSTVLFMVELLFGGIARTFFDYVVEYQMTHWGYILTAAGLPILAARFSLRHLQAMRLDGQMSDMTLAMKQTFLERLYTKSSGFFEAHFAGELYGHLRDLDECLKFYMQSIYALGRQLPIVLLATAVLMIMAPMIAMVHLIPSLFLILWMYLAGSHSRELEIRARDEDARHQSLQAQRTSGFQRFFASGMQNHLLATCLPPLGSRQAARAEKERFMIPQKAVKRAFEAMGMPLLAFVGAYLMIDGQLTYGGFMLASMVAVLLATQIQEISSTVQQFYTLRPTARRVAEVLTESDAEETADMAENVSELQQPIVAGNAPKIETRGMSFGYNGAHAELFQNVDLRIDRGEIINLAGPSGVGKTTLLELLAGLRAPTAGTVHFNGVKLNGPSPAGFVFADDEFVFGTLADFIAGSEKLDADRLSDILKRVELWDRLGFFINSDGEEKLESQGLSRGEIQRLLLAQALYRSDDCLFFDEAFSHLSLEQSMRILHGLRTRGTTVVMATHRPEIQALCDRSVILS